jgi:plastocyanin
MLAALAIVASMFGVPNARAGELNRQCVEAGMDALACDAILTLETAAQRPGVSVDDFTGDDKASIQIADFYFAPRISLVRNGQTVSFANANPPGGNRHSVSSSDWGSTTPVLPIPVASFGGGRAFRSGRLGPGEPFTVLADVAALDPAAYLLLPNGDAIIGYHCYIHGAAQMNGVLVVQGATS